MRNQVGIYQVIEENIGRTLQELDLRGIFNNRQRQRLQN